MANFITILRVILALFALAIIKLTLFYNLLATAMIIIVMLLDALDGFVARYLRTTTLSGSIYDILADRMIENIFFIYFASLSFFSVWFALIIMLRGLIVDAIRTLFICEGKTAFGTTTLHKTKWGKLLACSKLSRGLYNFAKLLTFISFTVLLQKNNPIFTIINVNTIDLFAHCCLWSTVVLAVIRAIPVCYEGVIAHKPTVSFSSKAVNTNG